MNMKSFFSFRLLLSVASLLVIHCAVLPVGLAQVSLSGSTANLPEVTWSCRPAQAPPYKKGNGFWVLLEAAIPKGLHVYSIQPTEKPANLPTQVMLADAKIAKINGSLTEKGEKIEKFDDVFETKVRFFKSKYSLLVPVKILVDTPSGVKGEVSYQVCDEGGKCVSRTYSFEF
jgi:hypothetical protein